MPLAEIALAARDTFEPDEAITMLAIAGAESAFNERAQGDRLSDFKQADRHKYEQFACNDFLSFGPWQVFLGVHTQMVELLSGLKGPCPLANWLCNPYNGARAARAILRGQGLSAWTTYNTGQYQAFVNEASAAIFALPRRVEGNTGIAITAVSFNGTRIHLDRADGSFEERTVATATAIEGWLRYDLDQPVVV